MKDIVIDVFLAAKDEFNKNNREHAFEIFGFDFLIDEDFRVWLIECNTNPYFGVPNKFIADLLPRMISEMLEITVDVIYPPKRKYPLPERNFELIYTPDVNTRRPFTTPLYPLHEPEKTLPRSTMNSRLRKSRGKTRRNKSVVSSKNKTSSMGKNSGSRKAQSIVRKHMSYKFAQKNLERAYLSSGDKSKSPALNKSYHKIDLNRANSSDKKTTITPRVNYANQSNLQLSVLVLTNELLSGKATGEFKSKSFQMVMSRIFQKIHMCTVQLSKTLMELSEPKNELYNSILPAISENQNDLAIQNEPMDLKQIKLKMIDPICESLEKLAKSKYIIKIGETDGGNIFLKLIKELKALLEDQVQDWFTDDDRKEQRYLKANLIKSVVESINSMLKNSRVKNQYIDDASIDVLIDAFLWANKHKEDKGNQENNQPDSENDVAKMNGLSKKNSNQISKLDMDLKSLRSYEESYDLLIQILCTICNIKPSKSFVSSAQV